MPTKRCKDCPDHSDCLNTVLTGADSPCEIGGWVDKRPSVITVNALVTANRHSDRVPYKNFQMLRGKTKSKRLYRWTTDFLGKNEELFYGMYFSSDEPEVFDYDTDKMITIKRPKALCYGDVPHMASVKHALIQMARCMHMPDYIMLFQPTNPFHSRKTIEHAIQLAKEGDLDVVYSYYTDTNLRTKYINRGSELKGDFVRIKSGNFYLYKVSALTNSEQHIGRWGHVSLQVPKFAGYNINNQEDFGIVTALARCHMGDDDYEL